MNFTSSQLRRLLEGCGIVFVPGDGLSEPGQMHRLLIVMTKPLVSFDDFGVYMPGVHLDGGHPVLILKNRGAMAFDVRRIESVGEAWALAREWRKRFNFSWWQTFRVFVKVARTLRCYQDALAAYRARAWED